MHSKLILITLILFTGIAKAQTLSGIVVDQYNQPLPFSKVVDTVHQSFALTDIRGRYEVQIKPNSVIRFSYIGKEDGYFTVPPTETPNSFQKTIKLYDQNKELQVVEVTAERIKSVADKINHNILDYTFLTNDEFLILKKINGERYLCIDGIDTTYLSYPISQRVKNIYIDCFDNVHLLSKDSAYQIYLADSLTFIERISIEQFNDNIKPCIQSNADNTLFSMYADFNKSYYIHDIHHSEKYKTIRVIIEDQVAKKAAQDAFNRILYIYHKTTPPESNVFALGVWDNDPYSLINNYTPTELFDMIAFFKQVESRPVYCPEFIHEDESIIIFDHVNNNVLQLNDTLSIISSFDFHLDNGYRNEIYQDKITHNYYCASKEKGYLKLRRINIFNGQVDQVLVLDEIGYPENIKVHNNYTYFVHNERSGFQKLKRVKL